MFEKRQDGPYLASPVGDLNSNAIGSGARYNAGKPAFDLIPLSIIATEILARRTNCPEAKALLILGEFQKTHDAGLLYALIGVLLEPYPELWQNCADGFTYGKVKYNAWNWAKGMNWSVPLACAARHLLQMIGEGGYTESELDEESGVPHVGLAMCNLVMLIAFSSSYPEGNDLSPQGLLK